MSIGLAKRVPFFPSHFPPRWQLKVVYIEHLESTFWQVRARFQVRARICPESWFWPDPSSDLESGRTARILVRARFGQNRDSGQILARTWILARIHGLARILESGQNRHFGQKSRFCQISGFLDPTMDLARFVSRCYMSTLRVRMCIQVLETPHNTMYAMHVRYMLATCTHTNRVKGKLLYVHILEKYAKFVHE